MICVVGLANSGLARQPTDKLIIVLTFLAVNAFVFSYADDSLC